MSMLPNSRCTRRRPHYGFSEFSVLLAAAAGEVSAEMRGYQIMGLSISVGVLAYNHADKEIRAYLRGDFEEVNPSMALIDNSRTAEI